MKKPRLSVGVISYIAFMANSIAYYKKCIYYTYFYSNVILHLINFHKTWLFPLERIDFKYNLQNIDKYVNEK